MAIKKITITAKMARDTVTFLLGGGGLVYQTLTSGLEKPTLILAFVAMMSTPFVLRKEEAEAKLTSPAIPLPPAAPAPPVLIPTPGPPPPETP